MNKSPQHTRKSAKKSAHSQAHNKAGKIGKLGKAGKTRKLENSQKNSSINQVRIVGGQFKRRNISFINADGLRPTPDRMRETLFNWLMYDINGADVLDACAGSGVLGFEALSRGASHVTFIEADKRQWQQLINTKNELKLSSQQASILYGQAESLLPELSNQMSSQPNKAFDVIFLDPPYALNLWLPIIQSLDEQKLINDDSIIYIEADKPIDSIFAETEYQQKVAILKDKKMGQVYSGLVRLNTSSKS